VRSTNRADQSDSEQLITLREAQRRAGLGLRQLERARAQGELTLYRVGGWRRVRWLDVETWLARQCRAAIPGRTPMPWALRAAARYLAELGGDIEIARAALDAIEAQS
jgi:hypothetical protein